MAITLEGGWWGEVSDWKADWFLRAVPVDLAMIVRIRMECSEHVNSFIDAY